MKFEIDFADSTIQYYLVKDFVLTLFLERWNAEVLEINFIKFIMFEATNSDRISAFEEVFETSLLKKAINYNYEKIPKEHNLRCFRFIDSNENVSFEIVCEDINIKNKTLIIRPIKEISEINGLQLLLKD